MTSGCVPDKTLSNRQFIWHLSGRKISGKKTEYSPGALLQGTQLVICKLNHHSPAGGALLFSLIPRSMGFLSSSVSFIKISIYIILIYNLTC